MQHDLHQARCACGREHVAAHPAGVPYVALSIGPRLRALAVYLVVFQHVPVERCRDLIADVAGTAVSTGFIHSCLAKAAALAADVVRLIRALITAAAVAGFDETTLRSGPAGEKKYVHGAFTEEYSAFWLGARSLESMRHAGILPGFAGIVVSDRYQNYFHQSWEHVAGNQACLAHILRNYQDCAETYPGAIWPVHTQRALRGLIHAWHAVRKQGLSAIPGRRAETAGARVPPRRPRRPRQRAAGARPEEHHEAAARPRAAGILPRPSRRRAPVRHRHQHLAHEQHQRARRPPAEDPAKDIRPSGQRRRHRGPARHQRLHRHRPQARP